jgi:hypothetical protein
MLARWHGPSVVAGVSVGSLDDASEQPTSASAIIETNTSLQHGPPFAMQAAHLVSAEEASRSSAELRRRPYSAR